jgi:serine/threonine-protein kinase
MGMYARYLPSGHLIYVTKGTLFAVPFDLAALEVRGAPALLGQVADRPAIGFAQLDFFNNGTLAYRTGGSEDLNIVQWLDGAGKTESLALEPTHYLFPRLSPDGSRFAYMVNQGSSQDLWIYDFERAFKTHLTSGQYASNPIWNSDGRFLLYQAAGGIFWARTDGAGKPQLLIPSKAMPMIGSLTPDNRWLAYSEQASGAEAEIRVLPLESNSGQWRAGEPRLFLKTANLDTQAAFSPDGRWLAYMNAEGGRYEVYVRAFPDNGSQAAISNSGGINPRWSRNGPELFYRTEDQRIMVVKYAVKGDSFAPAKPRVWGGKRLANTGMAPNFDLAADGKRIVAVMPAESTGVQVGRNHITVALNFFDEVRRRVAGQVK